MQVLDGDAVLFYGYVNFGSKDFRHVDHYNGASTSRFARRTYDSFVDRMIMHMVSPSNIPYSPNYNSTNITREIEGSKPRRLLITDPPRNFKGWSVHSQGFEVMRDALWGNTQKRNMASNNENDVLHSSSKGYAYNEGIDYVNSIPRLYPSLGVGSIRPSSLANRSTVAHVQAIRLEHPPWLPYVSPKGGSWYSGNSHNFGPVYTDGLPALKRFLQNNGRISWHGHDQQTTYHNFGYRYTDRGFTCRYNFTYRISTSWDCNEPYEVNFETEVTWDQNIDPDLITIGSTGDGRGHFYCGHLSVRDRVTGVTSPCGKDPNAIAFIDDLRQGPDLSWTFPIRAFPGVFVEESPIDDALVKRLQDGYFRKTEAFIPEIMSSAHVSAARASEDFGTVIESNMLETVSELNELNSLVPDKEPIQRFLRSLPRGKLLSGAISLTDVAANTFLLYKFGLAPAKDTILEYAIKYDDIVARARKQTHGLIPMYGDLHYRIGETSFGTDVSLTTRSKIMVGFPEGSLYMMALPMKAAGFDPSLSNLWELIPFSFVIDWFFKVGDRISLQENALRLMTLQIAYGVHSYKLTYTPRYIGNGPKLEKTRFTTYCRVVYPFFPYAINHNYDWIGGVRVPPLIGGALLWSVLRA